MCVKDNIVIVEVVATAQMAAQSQLTLDRSRPRPKPRIGAASELNRPGNARGDVRWAQARVRR